jgi:hypothetical protein
LPFIELLYGLALSPKFGRIFHTFIWQTIQTAPE